MGQIIEADEAGRLTLPPETLGGGKPHSRYRVEALGSKLTVEPFSQEALFTQEPLTPEEWMRQWDELSERISKAWDSDKSAAEIVSEMRR